MVEENITQNDYVSPKEIQSAIDDANNKLKEKWIGEIKFKIKPIWVPSRQINKNYDLMKESVEAIPFKEADICKYFKDNMHTRLYFESKYNDPSNKTAKEAFQSQGFQELKQQLVYRAFECGSPIISNGGANDRRFHCGICYRKNNHSDQMHVETLDENYPFRNESLISSDKGNRRKNGKSLRRKTISLGSGQRCQFGF